MIIGVASYKGGVGKTTTSVHVASYLSRLAPTVLFDGDVTRSATSWANEGVGFPFAVEPVEAAAMMAERFTHRVIDTGQAPEEKDLVALARYCDLLVVPTLLCTVDAKGLGQTIRALRSLLRPDGTPINFRVLITRVAPDEVRQVEEMRESLANGRVPMFATEIPRLKAFAKAQAKGVLVDAVDDPRAAAAWAAYEAVGAEVMG
jgi:chromosome partitioning protein